MTNLEKELGVHRSATLPAREPILHRWGKDKIIGKDNKYHAEDYYCVRCYREKRYTPAEKFFGLADHDATQTPYCQKCVNEIRIELWMAMEGDK